MVYTWNFKIYTGQDKTARLASTKIEIVLDLNVDLLGKGYTIYLDNWFSSPDLYLKLHGQKTNVVWTVRKNRQDMPEELSSMQLQRGDVGHHSINKGLVTLVWKDKKYMYAHVLSTVHMAKMADTGKRNHNGITLEKPGVYLTTMRG